MQNGFGRNGYIVEVVAANPDTISLLRTSYGARTVSSWWTPI